MSRAGASRAPSPTYTTFSGISNYRQSSSASSFRRPGGNVPPVPAVDSRVIARAHFEELSVYLAEYLAREPPNSRSTARQKLTRLTRQQFQELSTDVYDELMRRKADNENPNSVPFLPVRDDFHPKRNQARQKLATLPVTRFQDLSSDVYYELARRYPEFKDEKPPEPEPRSPDSDYDDVPSPSFDRNKAIAPLVPRASARAPGDRRKPSDGAISVARRKLSEDIAMDSRSSVRSRQSEDPYGGVDDGLAYGSPPNANGIGSLAGSRRKPSQDIPMGGDRRKPSRDISSPPNAFRPPNGRSRPSIEEEQGRRSGSRERDLTSEAGSGASGAAATATRDEIVPIKSTIAEEEVALPPFARRNSDGGNDETDELASPDQRRAGNGDRRSLYDDDDVVSPRSPQAGLGLGGLGGLSALSKRLDDDPDDRSPGGYMDRRRPSEDQGRGGLGGAREADLRAQIEGLERQLENAEADRAEAVNQAEERVRQLDAELIALRQRAEEQGETMRALRRELEEARTAKELAERDLNEEREEVDALKARCDALEQERQTRMDLGDAKGSADPAALARVQEDMQSLISELSELSMRNDELILAREEDMTRMRQLEARADDYKRKYERAKTELRSVKVTSQLFAQSVPRSGDSDRLPVSTDGVIADVHITAFLSAVDELLNAGRSPAPTAVLAPTRIIVNALHAITDDVKGAPVASSADVSAMLARCDATAENLVAAAKTHATSAGMSPVSLLDAAASHVSAVVTELGKTVLIRRARPGEGVDTGPGAFDPTLDPVMESPVQANGRRPTSEPGSSNASASPPPIFDRPAAPASDATTTVDGEDAWVELKPYLEAQTEAVVFAIQTVLSGVRNAATPTSALAENITRVITIVSSIVAVCKDSFPPGSVAKGDQLLADLSEQANRLSEAIERGGELSKEERQIVARSSFAVANAMKELVKL